MRRRRRLLASGLVLAIAWGAFAVTNAAPPPPSHRDSGGKAVAHRAGGKAVAARNAPTAVANFIGLPAGEPTLGVTGKGNVFYTAIQTNTRVEVVRSSDEGKTWELTSPKLPNGRNAQALSFDPYLWVDEYTDRIFTIDLTVACAYLSFSDDEGKSWTTNPLACGRPVNDHQTLFSGPPISSPTVGYENVVYYCWNDIATSACSKSLDGGISFVPTGSPAFTGPKPEQEGDDPRDKNCGGLHGHGHVGHDGTVYLPRGFCGQPYLAISKDEGLTWERVQVASNGITHHEAGIATDNKGNIYYTWIGADRLPYLAVSTDGGGKWSKPMMIGAPRVNESSIPGIAVGDAGKVAIVYMGTTNSPGFPWPEPQPNGPVPPDCSIAQVPCPDPEAYEKTTWNGYMTVSDDALGKNPTFYSATVNKASDPLKRGTCGPGRCGLTILDFIDVVIGPDGTPWYAFVDNCVGACTDPKSGQSGGNEGIVGHLVGGPKLR